PSVNRIRFFSASALAKAPKFRFAASCSAADAMDLVPSGLFGLRGARRLEKLDRPAGLLDRRNRRLRGPGDLELHGGLQLAIAEEANAVLLAPDHARFLEGGGGDDGAGIEPAGIDRLLHAAEADL